MSDAKRMLDAHPGGTTLEPDRLVAAIDAAFDCAQSCTACADACLAEDDVGSQVRCIALDLSCADVCAATGRVLSRQTERDVALTRALLAACVQVCRSCAEECERHAEMGMEHCRICAEACRRCEDACATLLAAIGD